MKVYVVDRFSLARKSCPLYGCAARPPPLRAGASQPKGAPDEPGRGKLPENGGFFFNKFLTNFKKIVPC